MVIKEGISENTGIPWGMSILEDGGVFALLYREGWNERKWCVHLEININFSRGEGVFYPKVCFK